MPSDYWSDLLATLAGFALGFMIAAALSFTYGSILRLIRHRRHRG